MYAEMRLTKAQFYTYTVYQLTGTGHYTTGASALQIKLSPGSTTCVYYIYVHVLPSPCILGTWMYMYGTVLRSKQFTLIQLRGVVYLGELLVLLF